jgi:hypothetical protein
MANTKSTAPAFARVRNSIRSLQSSAEEILEGVRKQAGKFAGTDRRKAIEHVVSQAKAFPADLQKGATKSLKALEARTSDALSEIRTQASKRLEPLVSRLSIPSKHEVDLLAKRLSSLEKKVESLLSTRGRGA